ncbi:DUF4136 domain-containing protein [Mangrovimonas sp. TPBH4]|uniref:DUF4136 domain-containing protein n=1 Tax=Mangrovimonas sp. TPBH4 TaxID=1645914 RepID=UPI0006B68CED|nr:DUF4136 domain-containing protein [Mangrovimonas sp. TPBH4]
MKNRFSAFICLTFFALMACAPVRVNYDYDRNTDFSKYKTYNYFQDLNIGMSELDANRFLDALDSAMAAKGMVLSDTPDFLINVQSNAYNVGSQSSVGVGIGGSGRNMGGGISVGIPVGQSTLNRQIQVDFVDPQGGGLFWQAISEDSFYQDDAPEAKEEKFNAIATEILKGYPPTKK